MFSTRLIQLTDTLEWDELLLNSTTGTFFQQKDWLSIWVKHFDGNPVIIGVYDGDKQVGIAPLTIVEDHIELLGTHPVLGGEQVSDYGDIIAAVGREREVWEAIIINIKYQISNIKNIVLNFIREDSPSFSMLQALGGKLEEADIAPFVDLPQTWDAYLTGLEGHDRHELKRKIRKLESEGAFKICYEGDESDFDEFFRLMSLSNEKKRNFLSEKMRQFFRDIFATNLSKKMMTLCFLKLDGKNIAAVVGFTFGKQFLLYNSGFDPSYGKLAPGFILKAYLIKHAIEQKITRFDFLRGNERYKYDLGGKDRKLYTITL